MRTILASAVLVLAGALPASANTSAYSELDVEKTCVEVDRAPEGEGEWARWVCAGYRGYPVLLSSDDGRDSAFFGFPPPEGPAWEGFSAFSAAGAKVEWRLLEQGRPGLPVAAILRFSVSDPEDPEKKTEVLVVKKVAQPGEREGCMIGLVMATGNPNANETARKIADEQAFDFACGADQPAFVSDDLPLPDWSGGEEEGGGGG